MTPKAKAKNHLYYGDNLDVLKRYIDSESIDLIYLDPPFNSDLDYNVLFKEHGAEAASQIQAFKDSWRWDENAVTEYRGVVETGGKLSEALQAIRKLVGENDMLAYLSMMAPRISELHRVLKSSGSIYLHCDPTASHYLKLLMDSVFGPENFQGEIIWRRTSSHVTSKRWPRLHDVILCYAKKLASIYFDPPRVKPDEEWIEREYRYEDERGRYSLDNLTGAGTTEGPSGRPWRGADPRKIGQGRHWRYTPDKLDKLDREGRIYWPKKGKYPKLKQYLHESGGKPVGDLWTDIKVIGRTSAERLGYPTQKPLALLERIVVASSREGGLVLDPFCGCGTTIDAAQKLNRQWIGIDITHLAINLIKHRLQDTYGEEINKTYDVVGEPTSVPDARILAESDPYQFQWWALGLVGARPIEQKKGADKGIDGRIYFHEGNGETKQVILSVKGGKNVTVKDVRDIKAVVAREEAAIGVLILMHPATKPMRAEAADAGSYESRWGKHPKIQIVTVRELLEGTRIDMPKITGANVTFKKATKHKSGGSSESQMSLREMPAEYGEDE